VHTSGATPLCTFICGPDFAGGGGGGAVVALSFSPSQRTVQTLVYPEGAGTVTGDGVFSPGQTTTLTASPAGCFAYWRENRSQQSFPNPYTFTVAADRTLEAVFNTSTVSARRPTTCSPARRSAPASRP
jgi:hypothetical protein